jgi:hypothetical protein
MGHSKIQPADQQSETDTSSDVTPEKAPPEEDHSKENGALEMSDFYEMPHLPEKVTKTHVKCLATFERLATKKRRGGLFLITGGEHVIVWDLSTNEIADGDFDLELWREDKPDNTYKCGDVARTYINSHIKVTVPLVEAAADPCRTFSKSTNKKDDPSITAMIVHNEPRKVSGSNGQKESEALEFNSYLYLGDTHGNISVVDLISRKQIQFLVGFDPKPERHKSWGTHDEIDLKEKKDEDEKGDSDQKEKRKDEAIAHTSDVSGFAVYDR